MGSIFAHRDRGISNDEWFKREIFGEQQEIVVSSTIKGTYYAAVRHTVTGDVTAYVILTYRQPRSHLNFGWKTLHETVSPEAHAPAKVLDALTETADSTSLEWRADCRRNLERKAKTLEPGTVVRLPQALRFKVSGVKALVPVAEFTYAPQPRRLDVFSAEVNGTRMLVRLPDWRSYAFEVVPA